MAAGRNRAVILAASHSGRLPLFPAVTEGQARASGDKERREQSVNEQTKDDNILEVRGISKRFGGIEALKDISFSVRRGEVHALVGENGAGKSTFIKILTGAHAPSGGTISFDGKEYPYLTPALALDIGITAIYQEFNLIPFLSVSENIYFGCELMKNGLLDYKSMNRNTKELFKEIGMEQEPRKRVQSMGVAGQQLVEIVKAISKKARLIIMDEPSAPLTEAETETLHRIVRQLREKGITIIYISHRMEEIFEICDRVSVFRDGSYISTSIVSETNRKTLIADMVGRQMGEAFPERGKGSREVIMEIRHLSNRRIHDVSLKLHRGEILGVGGLVGAGRTELLRAIYGADEIWEGEIMLNGETVTIASPAAALKYSIALLPEDRKQQGVVMGMSIGHNISLAILDRLSSFTVIRKKLEKELCSGLVKELAIKLSSLKSPVKTLSGGNQQKVVLAKCLATNCDILFIDEPTRGIDVGAKQEIYRIMRKLADRGTSILMVSSEMSELIGMSDRIIVMKEGQVAGELEPEAYSQETILNYAAL